MFSEINKIKAETKKEIESIRQRTAAMVAESEARMAVRAIEHENEMKKMDEFSLRLRAKLDELASKQSPPWGRNAEMIPSASGLEIQEVKRRS